MNQQKSTGESVLAFGKSLVPILGYYSGRNEGFKRGVESVALAAKAEVKRVNDSNKQLRHDLLFDMNAFVSPNGWDEQHWQAMVKEFIDENPVDGQDAKDILEEFISFCIEKYPSDRHFGETHSELTKILEILRCAPGKRMKCEKDDLELTVDFLDLFGNFPDEKGRGYVKQLMCLRNEMLASLDKSAGCNFLILGKTGSGKSALLNYILGSEEALSGAGRPVTERGLHLKEGFVNGVKVKVYDSWGLEAGHYQEWLAMMDGEKQKRDFHHKITDWFHVVVYCIQASGARVESVDSETINSFLKDGFNVVVALTKVDTCSEEDEETMKQTILADCPKLEREKIIPVCSVEKIIREVAHHAFGGDDIKKAITDSYVGTIVNQLPLRCKYLAGEVIDEFGKDMRRWIGRRSWSDDDNIGQLKSKCQDFIEGFNEQKMPRIIKDEIMACAAVSMSLSATINVDNDYFRKVSTELFEDSDHWYETVGKALLVAVGFIPVALYMLFGGATKQEREDMNSRLDRFLNDAHESVEKLEGAIRKQICTAFGYSG